VEPGDNLRLHCEYDNSEANQSSDNGQRREARDVFWGEGTDDEMCTASIYVHGIARPSTECPGSVAADTGQFEVTFDTQDGLRTSANLDGEFIGPVSGSVFRDEDVTLFGPEEGAEPVAEFNFDRIDLREGPDGPYLIDATLPAGDYQLLGFMDTDGNAEATDGPDLNDPIMIPSRAAVLQCEVQRITVRFPLLLPQL
jgi:hypothetical protein